MPSPVADTGTRQKPIRSPMASKLPSRPSSSVTNSDRPPHSSMATTAGLPQSAAIAPASDNAPLPAADSKIPKAPQTPIQDLDLKRMRPKSAALTSRPSSLPRATSMRETPAIQAPAIPNENTISPTSDFNKPLPSPPFAQLIDPNSPLKAQRTLVDAESGVPSQDRWPVLPPETVSPAEMPLTTDEKEYVQEQEPEQIVSTRSAFVHVTDNPVENRNVRSSAAFELRTERRVSLHVDQAASAQHVQATQNAEMRPVSSRNPYAKDIHAVSPRTDLVINSPLADRSIAATVHSVPPRLSSKRSSLPLSSLEPARLPLRSASSYSHGSKSDSTTWTRPEHDTTKALATESDDILISRPLAASISATTLTDVHRGHSPVQNDLPSASLEQGVTRQKSFLTSESSLFFGREWTLEPSTGWWSKQMAHGPTLYIHQDSDQILYGQLSQMPPDLPAPVSGHKKPSYGSLMGALPRHTQSSLTLGVNSVKDSRGPVQKQLTPKSPTAITPIRAMRPARQRSITPSPFNFPAPTRQAPLPPHTEDETTPVKAMVAASPDAELEDDSKVGFVQALYELAPERTAPVPDLEDDGKIGFAEALEELSPGRTAAEHARKSASTKKNRNILGVRIKSPEPAPHNTEEFMAQTASSAGKVSERKTSSEERKANTLKLKAKRSFRNLFAKNEPASTARTPTPSESRRLVANSGKTLANRISKNFSKVHVAEAPSNELENLESLTKRQSALTSLAVVSSSFASLEPMPYYPVERAAAVNHILANVCAAESATPELVRSLEIAETVVKIAELAKQNLASEEQARIHQHKAEMEALEMEHVRKRLQTMLQVEFEDETLRLLTNRLKETAKDI